MAPLVRTGGSRHTGLAALPHRNIHVWSFLEEYDLSGKTIIPFFTHNGSSSGASSISTVAELCPDSTVLTDDYFTYSGNNVDEAESAVDEWLTELGYNN